MGCEFIFFIAIEFHKFVFAELRARLFENRGESPARAAPIGIDIDHDEALCVDDLLKVALFQLNNLTC